MSTSERPRGGRRWALLLFVAGLGAFLLFAYAARQRLVEAWYLPALESGDALTRERAARTLADWGSARAAARIFALALESRLRGEVAVETLARLGPAADPVLLDALESGDFAPRLLATDAWLARGGAESDAERKTLGVLARSPWCFGGAERVPAPAPEHWIAAICGAARDERLPQPRRDRTRFVEALRLVAPRHEHTLRLLGEYLQRELADPELVAESLAPFGARGLALLVARYGERFSAAPDAVLGALARFGPAARGALPTGLARLDAEPSVELAGSLPYLAPGHVPSIDLIARLAARSPGVAIGLPFSRALGDLGPGASPAIRSLLEGPATRRALAASAATRLGPAAALLVPSFLERALAPLDPILLDATLALAVELPPDATLHETVLGLEARVSESDRSAWGRALLASLPAEAERIEPEHLDALLRAAEPAHFDLWRSASGRNDELAAAVTSRRRAQGFENDIDLIIAGSAETAPLTSEAWVERALSQAAERRFARAVLEHHDPSGTLIFAALSRHDATEAQADTIDWIADLAKRKGGSETVIEWLHAAGADGPRDVRPRAALALLRLDAIDVQQCVDLCLAIWDANPSRAQRPPLDLHLAPGLRVICELGAQARFASPRVEVIARSYELDSALRVEAWIALASMDPERASDDALDAILGRSVIPSRLADPFAGWTDAQIETLRALVERSPDAFLTALDADVYSERENAVRALARVGASALPASLRARLAAIAADENEPWPLRLRALAAR